MASETGGWARRGLLSVILAVVVALAAYNALHPHRLPGVPTPEIQALGARLEAVPEFRAWALAHPDVARDAARATRRGMHRLDDDTLKRRLTLMAKLTAAVDVRGCATIARGGGSQEQMIALLDKLPPADRRQYDDLIFRAAEAEVKGTPKVRWASRQRREAFYREEHALLVKEPRGERLIAALSNAQAATDADLCEATRALYRVVGTMPEALRNTAGLALLPGPAGHDLFDHPRWLALTDEALIARAQILEALLAQADEQQCAALARESATEGEVEALLQHVEPELQKWWPHLSHQLSFARGDDRRVTVAEQTQYWLKLGPSLGRDGFDDHAFNEPDDVSAAEACRAHRLFVAGAIRMPKRFRGTAARVLAGGGPLDPSPGADR